MVEARRRLRTALSASLVACILLYGFKVAVHYQYALTTVAAVDGTEVVQRRNRVCGATEFCVRRGDELLVDWESIGGARLGVFILDQAVLVGEGREYVGLVVMTDNVALFLAYSERGESNWRIDSGEDMRLKLNAWTTPMTPLERPPRLRVDDRRR